MRLRQALYLSRNLVSVRLIMQMPIDYVVDAGAAIASDARAVGRTFHIIDPEPLSGGHVALWTWDNGIMIARANILGAEREEVLEPRASAVRIAAAHEPD